MNPRLWAASPANATIGTFAFCATPASGNVHSVLIGLDANPAGNHTFDYQSGRDRMQFALDSGVDYLYLHPTWAAIEPAPGSYDFSEVDFNAQSEDHNLPIVLTFTFQAAGFMNNVFAPLTSLVNFFSYTYYLPDREAAFLQNTFDSLRFDSSQVIGANFVWMSDLPPAAVDLLMRYYGLSDNAFREYLSKLGYWDLNNAPKPAWPVFRQNAPTLHWIPDRPGTSLVSRGTVPTLNVDDARTNSFGGSKPVSGMAMLDYRPGGIPINQASFPDSPPTWSGRIEAELGNGISTRVAMANPGDQPSQVTFYFTDKNGVSTPANTFVMPAFTQLSAFLDQYPFNLGSQIPGTLTFYASAPVCAMTIRGHMNERFDMSSAPGRASGSDLRTRLDAAVPGRSSDHRSNRAVHP